MIQIATSIDAVFMQFIPCLILVILTTMILIKIKESEQRKASLKTGISSNKCTDDKVVYNDHSDQHLRKDKSVNQVKCTKNEDQTSNTLLAIVILFLICELPIACLLFAGIFDVRILYYVARRMYLLARAIRLINASLNFILYCFMSQSFRTTFKETFGPLFQGKRKIKPLPKFSNEGSSSHDMSESQMRSQSRSDKSITMMVEKINYNVESL